VSRRPEFKMQDNGEQACAVNVMATVALVEIINEEVHNVNVPSSFESHHPKLVANLGKFAISSKQPGDITTLNRDLSAQYCPNGITGSFLK
jgi:hypothetical protein